MEPDKPVLGSIIPLTHEPPVFGPGPEGYYPKTQPGKKVVPPKKFYYVRWKTYYDYPPAGRAVQQTECMTISKSPIMFRAEFNADMEAKNCPNRIGEILFWAEITEEEHLVFEEETG